ncbi:DNA polymerase domain-containing protein [Thermoclostridium stercorarium subsp. thermolacticum DSM 2910]|nr:non-homologous end-joining DNA ligase [Thermoclostridium stercorarium]AGI39604.1 LigD [Thermoclostridium stercorarium subsp. stercorarium DSM 8532]ANW98937.1 DNA polymerase domain-containing protein [Thermoclostridium stercorarium subsp. thermolacticum DSM 2910]ANX01466.1 DNA polymerase domain-containing protein [Thermoclostridium stercorarium subsp. leptospartum DSM 9219]UZQ84574.1 non-homologous end-joining DNA ligase [Thermoclostridium stercorarium]
MNKSRLQISNPDKLLFPDVGITKLEYIEKLYELSGYILKYTKGRALTTIHYPDGVSEKSYYQKNIPSHAPDFVSHKLIGDIDYIIMDSAETLLWLGNMAALEFHIPFNSITRPDHPDALVFDLDPSEGQSFAQVTDAAMIIYNTLEELGIRSYCKTSGATGLQIAVPLAGEIDYDTARKVNEFFGRYFAQKYPDVFTIERKINDRGKKIYFDYLQMWKGKTIICPYSPRATKTANVSAPVLWEEVEKGIVPEDFTLKNIIQRLEEKGDLYESVYTSGLDAGIKNLMAEIM